MKKFIHILMTLGLCLALSGCMKYKMQVNVDSQGKNTTDLKIMFSEDFIKNYLKSTNDQVISSFKTSLAKSSKNAKISAVEKTYQGVKYIGVESKASNSAMIKGMVKDGIVKVTIPVDKITNSLTSSGLDTSTLSNKNYTYQSLEAAGVEVSMSVTMPQKATSNVGSVKDKTVKIDLLKEMMKPKNKRINTITITSKAHDYTYLYYIGGVIGVAALIFVCVKLRKKDASQDETSNEQESETLDQGKEA